MVELDVKDLMQTNATIIAGILILLTLASSITDSFKIFAKISMAAAISPFIISILFLLVGKFQNRAFSLEIRLRRSARAMIIGLGYLLIAVVLLLVFSE